MDWFAGLKMDPDPAVDDAAYARPADEVRARRKWWLVLSLISNLSVLGFFKYFNFFVDSVQAGLAALGMNASLPVLQVVLPVGISFYTFQSLSYTIDVYRGRLRACRSLLDFALFVAFFPQLVAGPIERAEALVPRVLSPRVFNLVVARDALVLMAWGLFKKLVIADNVGVIANRVFSMKDPGFEMLWAGVFAFGVQIYADFSAYTDIARGTRAVARVRPDEELRSPVPRGVAVGLLAALAHLAVVLVSRLPLHPARRLAPRPAAHAAERDDHVRDLRPLAWRGVELRALGHVPRPAAGRSNGRGARCAASVVTQAGSACRCGAPCRSGR